MDYLFWWIAIISVNPSNNQLSSIELTEIWLSHDSNLPFLINNYESLLLLFLSCCFRGVHGHFTGQIPWAFCDEVLAADMSNIVGKISLLATGSLRFFSSTCPLSHHNNLDQHHLHYHHYYNYNHHDYHQQHHHKNIFIILLIINLVIFFFSITIINSL